MATARFNGVTINTANIQGLLEFYQALGLEFAAIKVTLGSEVYRAQAGVIDLALFAIKSKDIANTPSLQLSFQVDDLRAVFTRISALPGCNVILDPVSLSDGLRAVVFDPDGQSVELVQKITSQS